MKQVYIIITFLVFMTSTLKAQNFQGNWVGELKTDKTKIEILLIISKYDIVFQWIENNGRICSTVINPKVAVIKDSKINIKSESGEEYSGEFIDGKIVGSFKKEGKNYPLTLVLNKCN